MKRPTLPTANLDLLQRLYKWGVIWIVLFIIFFAVHSTGNMLLRMVSSLCFVGMVVLEVLFVNKVLITGLLARKHLVLFILISVFVLPVWAALSTGIDVCLLHYIDRRPFSEVFSFPSTFVAFMVRLIWFIATFAIVLIFYFQRVENEEKIVSDQLKSEKLDMELRYLKSQINPHFLFNALNNIYSMVYTHDDNAADGVLKLSEMLRYVLVDCQAEMIPLSMEIHYVESFIDFQLMRMAGQRDVVLEQDIENPDFMIAPMLLQPIIENCFKYSRLETHPEGYVHISIKQLRDSFCFEAENTVAPKVSMMTGNGGEGKKSGIGQNNVQQRLMLHYGENYKFDIQQDSNIYKVRIEL
ncbi:MAG: sensor histidine kinase [Bacteroidales bacterium]|nr:sensor histidine kinase [Bacteroidales bacterium]MBR0540306.1 sensor histidine kinase [Bacteroidales bacterium]MBR5377803.1 sensor histidine kinase [Bacteroidales bacterium]